MGRIRILLDGAYSTVSTFIISYWGKKEHNKIRLDLVSYEPGQRNRAEGCFGILRHIRCRSI